MGRRRRLGCSGRLGLEFDAAIVALPDNRQALRLQVNAVPEAGSLAVLAIDTLLIARRRVA